MTYTSAVYDDRTGANLTALLHQFNDMYLPYAGTSFATRNQLPEEQRRKGIIISYVDLDGNTVTEQCVADKSILDEYWGLDENWRKLGDVILNGELTVSSKGTWVINGEDTNIKAVGPKGDNGVTPMLKTINNKLHYSYDGIDWVETSENIAAWFRWSGNKIQISRDNKTWTDLSSKFADNVHIKGYVANYASLPTSAVQGDIYGVGPTYAAEDTAHTNPIYRYYVRNANSWVDNGSFTSISAGVVQETGDSETEVMSQKAVSEKLSELGSEVIQNSGYKEFVLSNINDYYANSDSFNTKKGDVLFLYAELADSYTGEKPIYILVISEEDSTLVSANTLSSSNPCICLHHVIDANGTIKVRVGCSDTISCRFKFGKLNNQGRSGQLNPDLYFEGNWKNGVLSENTNDIDVTNATLLAVEPLQSYTVLGNYNNYQIGVWFYDKDYNYLGAEWFSEKKIINTIENAFYARLCFRNSEGLTINDFDADVKIEFIGDYYTKAETDNKFVEFEDAILKKQELSYDIQVGNSYNYSKVPKLDSVIKKGSRVIVKSDTANLVSQFGVQGKLSNTTWSLISSSNTVDNKIDFIAEEDIYSLCVVVVSSKYILSDGTFKASIYTNLTAEIEDIREKTTKSDEFINVLSEKDADEFGNEYFNEDGSIAGVSTSRWKSYRFINHGYTNIQVSTMVDASALSLNRKTILFYSNIVPSAESFISGVSFSKENITLYSADVPDNCALIVVSGRNYYDSQLHEIPISISYTSNSILDVARKALNGSSTYSNVNQYDGKIMAVAYSSMVSGYPINSMEHFKKVISLGYPAIKADMRLTADNQIVLCHDEGYTFDSNGRITTFDKNNCTLIRNMNTSDILALEFGDTWYYQTLGYYAHPCKLEDMLYLCKTYDIVPYLTFRDEYIDETTNVLFEILDKYQLTSKAIINVYPPSRAQCDAVRLYSKDTLICYTTKISDSCTLDYVKSVVNYGVNIICFGYVNGVLPIDEETREYLNKKNIKIYAWNWGTTHDEFVNITKNHGVVGMQCTRDVQLELMTPAAISMKLLSV